MTEQTTTGIGIIGCGNIFGAYARGLARQASLIIRGCADIDQSRADRAAADHGLRAYNSVDELLADPDVEIAINLTPPLFHAEVTRSALAAGKHVYSEKPLAATFAGAQGIVAQAAQMGLRLGSAPDTFLGASGQTARAAVDSGAIGEVIGASAFVTHSHAERWHPDPTFLFRAGGGPSLDMGPYYITALVNLLGPVEKVYSRSRIGAATRPVTAPGRLVESITVEIPTHCAAVLTFASGVLATVMMSFDVWNHELPHMELYGTLGTLSVPDPDRYDDTVRIRLHADDAWQSLDPAIRPLTEGLPPDQLPLRGPGVADLAASLNGAPQRCNADLALHVLEVLETIALGDGTVHTMTTHCERPQSAAASGLSIGEPA